jgi:general stress protein YciG
MAFLGKLETKQGHLKVSKLSKGFAAMSKERVIEIARLGGLGRVKQLGRNGFASLGRKGGRTRAKQMSHADYVSMGKRGGLNRKAKRSHFTDS